MGIIDTLAAGFQTVARRPWPLLILIVLDLILWLGPRLTAEPVFAQFGDTLQMWITTPIEGATITGPDQAQIQEVETQLRELGDQLATLNLFQLLAWQMPSLVKSLAPLFPAQLPSPIAITLPAVDRFAVAVFGLLLIGLVWTSAYDGALAQYVRGNSFNRAFYFDRLAVNWLRLVGYYLLFLLGVLAIGLPTLFVAAFINLVAPALGVFLGAIVLSLLFLVAFLLIFTSDAIFVGDLNPIGAIKSSVSVVRRNPWSTLGLFLLTYLIGVGTILIWSYLDESPLLFVIALIGNAFISSGLTTAMMIFYRDRAKTGPATPPASVSGGGAGAT